MSSDIEGVGSGGLSKIADVASSRRVNSETAPEQQPKENNSRPSDTVALTDGARLLAKVESAVAQAPDVDVERVEAVKAAIQDGSYQIDDQQIADKILRSDVERG